MPNMLQSLKQIPKIAKNIERYIKSIKIWLICCWDALWKIWASHQNNLNMRAMLTEIQKFPYNFNKYDYYTHIFIHIFRLCRSNVSNVLVDWQQKFDQIANILLTMLHSHLCVFHKIKKISRVFQNKRFA